MTYLPMNTDATRLAIGHDGMRWLGIALIVVIGAATLEGLARSLFGSQRYDWRAYGASLADALGRRAVDALGLSLAAPVLAWAFEHRMQTLVLDTASAVALLFVGQEFFYYRYHRAAHRIGWFWATHSVHHSPNELTLASALRRFGSAGLASSPARPCSSRR
jgi:sterol desaturase/sphingolipid hydroxylase (fatty acid hydroxylase superfamily)